MLNKVLRLKDEDYYDHRENSQYSSPTVKSVYTSYSYSNSDAENWGSSFT